jgi:hypothetical protein
MAVARSFGARREQCFEEIERLTNSHSLRTSESLCKLLRYLAEHSLDPHPTTVKEYQIATEVFGRSPDFDPQTDSTVRVQAGRLRMKLAEYYAAEGAEDPIVVELPKGSYALTFHPRTLPVVPLSPGRVRAIREAERSPFPRAWAAAVVVLAILLIAALFAIANLVVAQGRSPSPSPPGVPSVYQIFWNRFTNSSQKPWVIFSNGSFVGRPETGMRYFNADRDSRSFILDHYTGVGEVLAINQLDELFALLRHPLAVERGGLFSLDNAKNNDLIFVGSPSENLTLLDIPGTQEFVFRRLDSGPRKGDLSIVNVHPQNGEQRIFLSTPANQPTTEDYAVVGLLPGLDPSRSILILAGSSTFGTQAAVEYVCRQDSLAELLRRLAVSRASDLKSFEALLHVKIAHGVPVATELISVRKGVN